MSTRVKTPVGPSSSTLNTAAHPAVPGTEVPGPVPDTPAPAPPGTPVVITGNTPLALGLRRFMMAFQPAVTDLGPLLRQATARVGSVRSDRVAAAPWVANLLRNHPTLASDSQPEAIEAGVADLNATQQVVTLLKEVTALVEDTGRLAFDDGWTVARVVYRQGELLARRDKAMAIAMAPVQSLFQQGSRTVAASRRAQTAQARATAAQQRATASQQRAVAATAAAVHTVAAHTARHPTKGTSPVPLANPQGPAASADVAPQGPAPVPVPGSGR